MLKSERVRIRAFRMFDSQNFPKLKLSKILAEIWHDELQEMMMYPREVGHSKMRNLIFDDGVRHIASS
jgi:hypothetical protein